MLTKAQINARKHLGLHNDSTAKQIYSALRRAMLKCHPDKHEGKSKEEQDKAKE